MKSKVPEQFATIEKFFATVAKIGSFGFPGLQIEDKTICGGFAKLVLSWTIWSLPFGWSISIPMSSAV